MMIMKSNHAYKCDKEQCLYYKQLGSSKKSHFLCAYSGAYPFTFR